MADNKDSRDKQAHDADRRQRKRAISAELARGDEPEPPVENATLDGLDSDLEAVSFPATGADIVPVIGDRTIDTDDERYTVEELVPAIESDTFESPSAVRVRVQRPTVATAMKRVLEAADTIPNTEVGQSQRDAYEKTFRALIAIDAVDDDEGVTAIADWIVERIDEKGTVPGSRGVRRQAAKHCRANGYEIRNDEWLGV